LRYSAGTRAFVSQQNTGIALLNLRQFVELVGIVSAHSPNLIEASVPLSRDALQRYEDYSVVRTRNWLFALDELPRELAATPPAFRPAVWDRAQAMFADLFAGGLAARVWGAVLSACSRTRRDLPAEKAARCALAGQLEAQTGALRLLVEGQNLSVEQLQNFDKLRRRIERWTDLFLGHLVGRYALADFAYDLERALDFGQEQLRESWGPRQNRIWDLYFLCLHSVFPDDRLPGGIQAEWREELLHSILGCFPPELFIEEGPLKSVRLQRYLNAGTLREGPPAPLNSAARRSRRNLKSPGRWTRHIEGRSGIDGSAEKGND
jgi:hypothetical protein